MVHMRTSSLMTPAKVSSLSVSDLFRSVLSELHATFFYATARREALVCGLLRVGAAVVERGHCGGISLSMLRQGC